MDSLDTNAYYALGIPAYVLLVLFELWRTSAAGLRAYGFADAVGNMSAGMGEIVLGLFIGPLLVALYDHAYRHWALVRWDEGSWIPWVLAFFLADFCYYVYHRAGHGVAVLYAIHGVHHQSEEFNVTVAMRHPWFSDFYSAPFYAPLPLLGIGTTQFFVAIAAISFYSLSIHSRVFQRRGWFIFTTPATHIVHHCRNPRYIGRNLGAMFTLWDRMFGTHVEVRPDDPPCLGTPKPYETHNGARAQWIGWRDLWHAARAQQTLRGWLSVWLGPPRRHPGVTPRPTAPARDDATIPLALKVYAALQLAAISCFSMYVLWLRDRHSLDVWIVAAVLILFSLYTLGSLLDGEARALRHETWRLVAWIAGAAWMVLNPAQETAGWALLAFGLFSVAWVRAPWPAAALRTS